MRILSLLLILGLTASTSFALDMVNFSPKEKGFLSIGAGCAIGAGTGFAIANGPNDDRNKAIFANTLIGCAGGAIYSWFFQDDDMKYVEENKRLKQEIAFFKSTRKLNESKFELEAFNFQQSKSTPPSFLKYGNTCSGNVYVLCPSSDKGIGGCKEPQVAFLNGHWAVQYVAYLSPEGCFNPNEVSVIPGLKEYLDQQFQIKQREYSLGGTRK